MAGAASPSWRLEKIEAVNDVNVFLDTWLSGNLPNEGSNLGMKIF